MYRDDFLTLKEAGQKGDFLLPYVALNTIMPDLYTTYPMHWHDEMEIVYVESGEFEESIDLENYHVRQGDIILINPCSLHSFRQIENKRTLFRTIIFNFNMLTSNNTDACSIKYFTPFLDNMYISPVVISAGSPHYDEVLHHVETLIELYNSKEEYFEIKIKAELFDLFHLLFKYYFQPETNDTCIKENTTQNIKTILDYIEKNYTNPITIEELAECVGLSKHYFMRFFKKYMGMTCIEYINDYRLNIAANLLITSSMQITEVASRIGITNLSYFNRIFKKKYNMTPKEYRYHVNSTK